MEERYKIALNFLPINNNDFSFTVHRRLSQFQQEKRWDDSIRSYNLPNNSGEYKKYWVGFTEFKDSEIYECKSSTNNFLTLFYFFFMLKNVLRSNGIKFENDVDSFNPFRIYISLKDSIISDRNNKTLGKKVIWLEPYFLKSKRQLGFLINYRFLKDKNYPFDKEIQKLSLSLNENYRSNVAYHIDKYRIIRKFISDYKDKIFNLKNGLSILDALYEIDSDSLKTKIYVVGKNSQNNSQFKGIMNNGPFRPVQDQTLYYFIFKNDDTTLVNDLVRALNGEAFATFKGLNKFQLPNISKENNQVSYINSYQTTEINKIVATLKRLEHSNIITIFLFPRKEEKFYYQIKNELLRENIPTQGIHIETIANENQLKWSVASIALQIFSKLGGIPWKMVPSNKNCLIVGIGQSHQFNDETEEISRYYAYSVLIDSSGEFKEIRPIADVKDRTEYLDKITESVTQILNENKNYNKVTFHIPQKIKKYELDQIKKTLEKENKDIELVIIKINDNSKFFGYNISENSLVPYESSYLKLSNKEYLLWTEGLNYHNKKPMKRYGHPLHIEFFYQNQDDIKHETYLQDILNLSGANWRGFNAKSLPISIFYPKIISKFNKQFDQFNLKMIKNEIKTPWFL